MRTNVQWGRYGIITSVKAISTRVFLWILEDMLETTVLLGSIQVFMSNMLLITIYNSYIYNTHLFLICQELSYTIGLDSTLFLNTLKRNY